MVKDDFRPHAPEEPVEAFRRKAFEEAVRVSLVPACVDHFIAFGIGINHLVHGIYVVLPVAINGNAYIAVIFRFKQSGEQCVLMPPVPRQGNSLVAGILRRKPLYNIPRAVGAAVIDKEDAAVFVDFMLGAELYKLVPEKGAGYGQDGFLIITGDDNIQ